jgi:2',5'-phosphodiesterase
VLWVFYHVLFLLLQPIEEWNFSENRQNIMLFIRIKDKEDPEGKPFCISNYHMPCAFYAPKVMTIHADMVAKRTQDLAGSDPHVLVGDFNILPSSATYGLLTTGDLPKDDPTYPSPKHGVGWTPSCRKMRSAYATHSHGEPDFTNYAKSKDSDTFIETLDYFFLSDEWTVKDVTSLKHRDDVEDGPFPNADEPSDHVLISATLEIINS